MAHVSLRDPARGPLVSQRPPRPLASWLHCVNWPDWTMGSLQEADSSFFDLGTQGPFLTNESHLLADLTDSDPLIALIRRVWPTRL